MESTPKFNESAETFSSKIELKFFRHDEKESDKTKTDEKIRLTPAGREHAMEQADLGDISQAVAFASPRERTQETAGFQMAGALDTITGDESLEELKEKIDGSRNGADYGTKMMVDPRLNFNLDNPNEYVKKAEEAFAQGRLLKFLVEESDALAEELGDTEHSTYTRQAAAVAEIIAKYLLIAPRFEALVHAPDKSYEDTMQRFFGTHQSIGEAFLAKVIEKTEGVERRDQFVATLKNKGFGFSEGFKVDIVTPAHGKKPKIQVAYSHEGNSPEERFAFDKEIPAGLLEEIATDKV